MIALFAVIRVAVYFGTKPKEEGYRNLDLSQLVLEDGSYGWNGLRMNSSIEEVEEELGIQLKGAVEEAIIYAEFTPVNIQYKDYLGQVVLIFQDEKLAEIHFDFETEKPGYENNPEDVNDLEAAYAEMVMEMISIYGESHYESRKIGGTPHPAYGWISDVSVGDGLQTRLEVATSDSLITRITVRTVSDGYTTIQKEPLQDEMGLNFAKYYDQEEDAVIAQIREQGLEMVHVSEEYHDWYIIEEIDGYVCHTRLIFYDLEEKGVYILCGYSKRIQTGDGYDWELIEKAYDYLVQKLGDPVQVGQHSYRHTSLLEKENYEEYSREHFQEALDKEDTELQVFWNDDWKYMMPEDELSLWEGNVVQYSVRSPAAHEFVLRMKQ